MKVTPNPSFLDWVPPNVKKKAEGYHLHIKLGSRNPPGWSFPGEDYRRVWTMYILKYIQDPQKPTWWMWINMVELSYFIIFHNDLGDNFRPPNPPWVRCTIWSFETTTLVGSPMMTGSPFRTSFEKTPWLVTLGWIRYGRFFGANDHKYVSISCSLFTKPRKSHALV